jgi:hypothetical protein
MSIALAVRCISTNSLSLIVNIVDNDYMLSSHPDVLPFRTKSIFGETPEDDILPWPFNFPLDDMFSATI